MDQRGSLEKSIAKARGGPATAGFYLVSFKNAVTSVLTKHASAILLDPSRASGGEGAGAKVPASCSAYEKTGYDTKDDNRMPDLLPSGACAAWWTLGPVPSRSSCTTIPAHPVKVNDIKHAFIERVGGECEAADVPFFLEIIAYDDAAGDAKSLQIARVSRTT